MNPFIIKGYQGEEYFCDRKAETDTIINAVKNQRNITLTSLRKMGKTGLIWRAGEKLKNVNIHLVYFDILGTENLHEFINEFGGAIFKLKQPLAQKIPRVFNSFLKSLRPTINYNALSGMPSLSFSLDNQQQKIQTLEDIFNYLKLISDKVPLVVAIDEFQQIDNYPEENVEALLRKNIQFLNNVQFIFSGSNRHILLRMFTDAKKPFYQSTQLLHLQEIPEVEYHDFVWEKFEGSGKTITDDAIGFILNSTRMHTYYVQYVFNKLFGTGKRKLNKTDAELMLKNVLLENEPYYFEYRNLITPSQWSLLIALAKEDGIKEVTSGDFIKKHKLTNPATVRRGIEALLQKELIFSCNEMYYVYDVFFALWLKFKF